MKFFTKQELWREARVGRQRGRYHQIRRKFLRAKASRRYDLLEKLKREYAAKLPADFFVRGEAINLAVPKKLCLRTRYDETVQLFNDMRENVLLRGLPIFLHFEAVEEIDPSAVLVLAAEIYRCRHLRPGRGVRSVNGNFPSNGDVFLQLRDMGFYELLGIANAEKIPDAEPDRPYFIRFRTFATVLSEQAEEFRTAIPDDVIPMSEQTKGRMQGAIIEAMGNAHEHSDKGSPPFPIMGKRWWLAGHVDRTEKEVMIMLYDQGVGIPSTLEPSVKEQVLAALTSLRSTPSDGDLIRAATQLHRTSSGQAGRGKGFETMKKFVRSCDNGELWVLSNRGEYQYINENSDQVVSHPESLGGTLVLWRLRHATEMAEIE